MATTKATSMLPRFRRIAPPEEDEEKISPTKEPGAHGKRRTTDAFQDDYLETKLRKEKGLADQAETEAAINKLKFDEMRGKLVTMNRAQEMLEQEHVMWLTELEKIPADIVRRCFKKGIPLDIQEKLKEFAETSIHALRVRLARVDLPKN